MNKSFTRIASLIVLLATALSAQSYDVINLNNGNSIKARIIGVTNTEVRFKKAEAPDGPTYTLNKRNIESIDYDYGDTEIVDHTPAPKYNDMAESQVPPTPPTPQTQPQPTAPAAKPTLPAQPTQPQPRNDRQAQRPKVEIADLPLTGVDSEKYESNEMTYTPAETAQTSMSFTPPVIDSSASTPGYNDSSLSAPSFNAPSYDATAVSAPSVSVPNYTSSNVSAPAVDYTYDHGLYNNYSLIYDYPNMGNEAKKCVMTFGVNPRSDIYDDNIEIAFISGYTEQGEFMPHSKGGKVDAGNNEMLVFVKNKTSRPIYIDLTQSVFKRGDEYVTIYDPDKATRTVLSTVELTLDLCTVSNTLRKMINGVNTDLNWKEQNVTKHTLANEQTLCLMPYSAILISNQFISNEFKSDLPFLISSRNGIGVNLGNNVLREGQTINYDIDNTPLNYSMTVAYSTKSSMDDLRTVNSEIYLRSILGLAQYGASGKVNLDEIANIDKLMIGHVLGVCHDIKKPQIQAPQTFAQEYMQYYR